MKICRMLLVLLSCCSVNLHAATPDHVDLTWMSITNMYFEVGDQRILADGYFTRLPESNFYGGGGGYKNTHVPFRSDVLAVKQVMYALGGKHAVNLLLTGHSHFDHSFDTATWSLLTHARIIGAPTTCLQAQAQKIPAARCTSVYGGEKFELAKGIAMYVIRWNHSGNSKDNPEQHDPVELSEPPHPDSAGALLAGVAEDFPNGGGSRAYLFVVDGKQGRFSWLFTDSAGFADIDQPVVINGVNYGAPLENLRLAMKSAGVEAVDLWIATGGVPVAQLVLPIARPKAYLPVHWDGLWYPFLKGVPYKWSDPELETLLAAQGVNLVRPLQYMDKWRLDVNGVSLVSNEKIKKQLGFDQTGQP
ncbi:MAG TPA: hypothetical protein VG962_03805 [Steroidobacteraceae bacterium]|nr:hypothetical protein [Steroidobacteraceae bacterium]